MQLSVYLSAVLALLLAPGPTNTLIGLAGAQRGIKAAMRLMPFELIGYLVTIVPLTVLGAALMSALPQMAAAVKLAAALWVAIIALRLWGRPGAVLLPLVSPWLVFITTALNPKALIFGIVLLPVFGAAHYGQRLALFCAAVAGVALVWGAGGALLHKPRHGQRLHWLQRGASIWLGLVSLALMISVIRT